jgi:hypothetical protein
METHILTTTTTTTTTKNMGQRIATQAMIMKEVNLLKAAQIIMGKKMIGKTTKNNPSNKHSQDLMKTQCKRLH